MLLYRPLSSFLKFFCNAHREFYDYIFELFRELDEARTTDGFMDEFMDSEESWSDADKVVDKLF